MTRVLRQKSMKDCWWREELKLNHSRQCVWILKLCSAPMDDRSLCLFFSMPSAQSLGQRVIHHMILWPLLGKMLPMGQTRGPVRSTCRALESQAARQRLHNDTRRQSCTVRRSSAGRLQQEGVWWLRHLSESCILQGPNSLGVIDKCTA